MQQNARRKYNNLGILFHRGQPDKMKEKAPGNRDTNFEALVTTEFPRVGLLSGSGSRNS